MTSTSGLLFVESMVPDPFTDQMEEDSDKHVPDPLGLGSTTLRLTYKNVDPDSKTCAPYLYLSPSPDLSYLFSQEFDNLLKDTKVKVKLYEKLQSYEGLDEIPGNQKPRAKTLLAVAMEPSEEGGAELDEWYRKQHLDMMAMLLGYVRTTRYDRIDGVKPRYLTLHEWSCGKDEMPAGLSKTVASEWSRKILADSPVFQNDMFELVGAQGDDGARLQSSL